MKPKSYIPELYSFLEELGRRQDREWFRANRQRYDDLRALWLADIDCLIALIGEWWPEVKGMTAKGAAYRIYRDTRFSPDKSPFKSYFSAGFSRYGRSASAAHLPGLYLQMGPGRFAESVDSGLYGGVWQPSSADLKKLRRAIVDNIEEFEEIISAPELERLYPGWYGDRLKTIPKGYDRDHPQAELLRLKEYGRFLPADMAYFNDPRWPEKVADDFRPLLPLLNFFTYSLEEEV